MAKKGPEATERDVIESLGVLGEPHPLPAPVLQDPDDDLGDRPARMTPEALGASEAPDIPHVPLVDAGDVLARLTTALEALASRQPTAEPTTPGALEVLSQAIERLVAAQIAGADQVARATRAAARPSNEIAVPGISAYNPRGDKDFPRPQLKCKMFLPWPAEPEALTREEIELLNLMQPGDYAVRRNDGTKIKVYVRARYHLDSTEPSELLINHETAFNNDQHRLMPLDWLRQIVSQHPKTRQAAALVLTMDEEIALILAGQLNDGSHPPSGRVISIGE